MGISLAAICSKSIKCVRSYQIYLILDLNHLTKNKLVCFQVSLLKVKIYLNKRNISVTKTLRGSKQQKLTKIYDTTVPTFSKLTRTFS